MNRFRLLGWDGGGENFAPTSGGVLDGMPYTDGGSSLHMFLEPKDITTIEGLPQVVVMSSESKYLGPIIAERTLSLANNRLISIRIGQPFIPQNSGGNFCCPFHIDGIGDGEIWYGWGVDSLQALYMALLDISSKLYTSDEAQAGQITWEGERELGLPVHEVIKDLVPKRESPRF